LFVSVLFSADTCKGVNSVSPQTFVLICAYLCESVASNLPKAAVFICVIRAIRGKSIAAGILFNL
jgi:hypothetical protein